MKTTGRMRLGVGVAVVATGALVATACGSGGDDGAAGRDGGSDSSAAVVVDGDDPGAEQAGRDVVVDAVTGGGEGRPFGADDAAVEAAIDQTLSPKDVRWEGQTLYVVFDHPADPAKLRLNCSTADGLLGPDETVVVVYTDEEVDCTEVLG